MNKTISEVINEINRIKKQFLYHKALVGYIPPGSMITGEKYGYNSGNYYDTKACIIIEENGLSREEHNAASNSANQWFIVYCAEIIKARMTGFKVKGFEKIERKNKSIPLTDFSNCQLLYILRDKLSHVVYRNKENGEDRPYPYRANEVAEEIFRRFKFDREHPDNDSFSLPVDKVVIPLIDACLEEINTTYGSMKPG